MSSRFSTSILDEVLMRQKKEREEQRLRLLDRIHEAISQLSTQVAFQDAYVFGSVVKPHRFIPDSDVDIGFIGLKDEGFFKAMAFLSEVVGRDVDVLQLEGHRMEWKVKREGIRWKKEG